MICTGKSGSNWLDRLRSSKGFPDGNGDDLEHFLNTNPKPGGDHDSISERNDSRSNSSSVVVDRRISVTTTPSSKAKAKAQSGMEVEMEKEKEKEKENLFDVMSSVLAELFIMGGDSGKFRGIGGFDDKKKSSRKQSNPKICVLSAASASVDDDCRVVNDGGAPMTATAVASPCSADNSVVEEKRVSNSRLNNVEKQGSLNVEDDKSKVDFSGYSKAEVMIIDTSAPVWKSEKIIFRKGNVWKVRDKKSKCRKVFGSRKKRKTGQSDSEGAGKKKQKKREKLFLSPAHTAVEAVQGKCIMLSNEDHLMTTATKEGFHNLNEIPETRDSSDQPGNQQRPVRLFSMSKIFPPDHLMTTAMEEGFYNLNGIPGKRQVRQRSPDQPENKRRPVHLYSMSKMLLPVGNPQ